MYLYTIGRQLKEREMKLSNNFSLAEFTKSQTALRLDIDNTPGQEHLDAAIALFDKVVQPVRDQFGPTTINSGYRGPELNKAVGGSSKSQHCNGEAVDIECPGVANYDIAKWIEDNLEVDQLIWSSTRQVFQILVGFTYHIKQMVLIVNSHLLL
jgi:zinc D-Ala-D-Ala carboxypeptidase